VSVSSIAGVARYIMAPGLRLQRIRSHAWRVLEDEAEIASVEIVHGHASRIDAHHAPQFGVLLATDCLMVELVEGRATTRWSWQQ
jgi:hypothetical protein